MNQTCGTSQVCARPSLGREAEVTSMSDGVDRAVRLGGSVGVVLRFLRWLVPKSTHSREEVCTIPRIRWP